MCGKNKNLLVLSSLTLAFCIFSLLTGTVSASTGVSPDVSFEGKIVNSSGVNITNATYNVEFTMYTGCTNEPTNNTGCTLAWTEDYLTSASEGVAMNGGTFEVNLGQYCSFAGGSCQGNTNTGINWNSYPIYMSMQIGGTANCSSSPAGGLFTANCSGDGVMQPYILMTSTPYAQNASTVGGIAATSFAQLAAGSQTFTGANIFEDSTNSAGAFSVENNAAKNILGVDTSGNQVVFGNATTNVGQVVFDDGTNSNAVTINAGSGTAAYSLTLPTVAPTTSQCLESGASTAGLLVFATCGSGSGINNGFTLQSSASFDIQATSGHVTGVLEANGADILDLKNASAVNVATFGSTGAVLFENSTNSTTAFSVQTSAAANVLNVNTTNSIVSVGALATPGTLTATQAPLAGSLTGTAGSTSYTYEITAVSANGSESLASTETNAALAASITTNHITVNWTTNGAAYYKIYRTASGGTPSSLGLVGTSTTGSFVDTGYSAGAQPPALANTGTLAVSTNYYYEVTALDDTYTTGGSIGQTLPSAQLTGTTNSYNKSLTIDWAPVNGARAYNVYRTTTTGVYTTDSYYTVYTNSFTDTNATATGTNVVPPTTDTAYGDNDSDNANANVTIGSNGTTVGQLYVGGSVPTAAIGSGTLNGDENFAVNGNYVYGVGGTSDFEVYNVSNPTSPVETGTYGTSNCGNIGGSAASGNYVYEVCNADLYVINVSNPSSPSLTGAVASPQPYGLAISGNYVYVTTATALNIYNVINPANPTLVGSVAVSGGVWDNTVDDITVVGNYAYIVSPTPDFYVVNVSNPANPTISSITSTHLTSPESLSVINGDAYISDFSGNDIAIFSVNNPANPTYVSSFSTGASSNPAGSYIQGQYLYVTESGTNAISIIDISNPVDPSLTGTINNVTGYPNSVVVNGRYLYVNGYNGNSFQIFDLGGAYIQQLQTGGVETSTLQVDSNANVSGDESITGGLSVGSSAEVSGSLGVGTNLTVVGLTTLEGVTAINGVYGGYSSIGLAAPSAPTITFSGTTGNAVTWSYEVEAIDAAGNTTAASPAGSITTADSLGLGTYASQTVSSTTFATPHVTYNVPSGQPFLTGMDIVVGSCSGTGADNGTFAITSETTSTIVVSNASGVAGETGCIVAAENNFNTVSWSAVTGAVNYYVFRTVDAAGGSPSTTGYIGSTTGTSLQDNANAGTATYLAQATDTTNSFITKTATNSTTAFSVQTSAAANVLNVNTTNSIVSVGALATPGTLTATQAPLAGSLTGTAGSTSYTYEITAVSANGSESLASTETNAALAASITTNHITVNWTTNGAAYYKIYRTASGGTPSSLGLVGTSTTGSFVDTGYSAGAQPPALANTGTLAVSTNYYYEVTALDDTYTTGGSIGQTLPSAQLTGTTNAYNKSLTIDWAPVNGARAYNVYRTTTTGVYTTDSYYTVYTNSFTDTNATATGTNVVPPTTDTAYGNDLSNNAAAQITVGGNGTETGQLYVGGQVPTSPVGSISTGAGSGSVAISTQGSYTYVVNSSSNTLQVINVANPADPISVGIVSTGASSSPQRVYVTGHYAYVTTGSVVNPNTLSIFNISTPSNPVLTGSVVTGPDNSDSWGVYVSGKYAYVTSQNSGTLQVIDVSNPANPVIVGSYGGINEPVGIYVQGSYAYVDEYASKIFEIFNIANPASPTLEGSVTTGDGAGNDTTVTASGNYAYVTSTNYGNNSGYLDVIDISNPFNPVIVGEAVIGTFGQQYWSTDVAVQGRYVYVATGNYTSTDSYIDSFDVSNPADPVSVGSTTLGNFNATIGLSIQGRYAYVTNGSTNVVQIFDLGGAYVQQLQAGGAEVGALAVDADASVAGDASIGGGLTVGNSVQVSGNVGVGSNLTVAGLTALEGVTSINGVYGGYSSIGLATPSAPTVTFSGIAGSAVTWSYEVEAIDAAGNTTAASPVGSITTGDSLGLGTYAGETVSSTTFATPHVTYNVPSGQPYITGMGITVTSCSGTGADNGTYTVTSETTSTIVVSNASGVAGETGCLIVSENNYNTVSWSPVTGAVNYYVFRTVDAAGGIPSTTGFIGATTGTSLLDTAIAGTATHLVQTTDSTNSFITKTATNSTTAFQVQNSSSASILNVDTANSRVGVDNSFTAMASVGTVTPSTSTTGGTLAATTYYYEVTALDGTGGQTTPSTQVSQATTGTTSTVTLSWTAIAGAEGYNIYRSTTSGVYTTDSVYGEVGTGSSGTISFTDTGSTAGITNTAPPTTDTAYIVTANSQSALQVSVGGNGTPTGQLYVSGTVPASLIGAVSTGAGGTFYNNVYVQGSYAYVTNYASNTLQIVNVSNPASPVDLGSVSINYVGIVYVQGNYAYVDSIYSNALVVVNVSNPVSPVVVGSVTTDGNPGSVYVQGDYAYVTNWNNSIPNTTLQIINISDPSNPVIDSTLVTSSSGVNFSQVYVQGNYAYIANSGNNELQIVNVSNPTSPVLDGNVGTPIPQGLYVQGAYAYVANYGGLNLQIVNISNPATPLTVGSVSTYGDENSVYVQGRYAYMGSSSGGSNTLGIFDVSNPANPVAVGSAPTGAGTGANSIFIQGRYAYVEDGANNTLEDFDLGGAYVQQLQAGGAEVGTLQVDANANVSGSESITGGLTVGGSVQLSGGSLSLQSTSSQALEILNGAGNEVFDTGAGSSSITLRQQNTNNFPSSTNVQTISFSSAVIAGDTLVLESGIASSDTITGITGDGVTWQLATSYNDCIDGRPCGAGDLETWYGLNSTGAIAGATISITYTGAVGAGGANGLVISDWSGVSALDSAAFGYTTIATAPKNTPTLIPSSGGELVIAGVDFNNSSSPVASPYTALPFDGDNAAAYYIDPGATPTYASWPPSSAAEDDMTIAAFTATTEVPAGVTVIGNSTVDGATSLAGKVTIGSIGTATSQLYVGGNSPGNSVGAVATGGAPFDSVVQGNYAYVANYSSNTLQIFDITNPATPILVGTVATGTNPESVYVSGRYAYVGNNGSSTLQIFDVSNPASPVQVSSISTGTGDPSSVYVSGKYAYVTNVNGFNFQIYDISNPVNPTLVGTGTTTQNPYSIFVQGRYAYVTSFTGAELQIYDVSNPSTPVNVGNVATTGNPRYVYVQGDYAYVANQGNGTLQVFNVSIPTAPALVGTATAGSDSESVYVQGRYAYLTNENGSSFQIFDISTPSNPVLDETTSTDAYPQSIFVSGRFAYVADQGSGEFQIFDLGGAYVQQLQAGGAEIGTLSVDNNAQISGSESVTGGLNVSGATQLISNVSAGGLNISDGLVTPSAPTETVTCSGTCASSYTYAVAATNPSGTSALSPTVSTAAANATLNTTTEYNRTNWSAVTGATSYNIYRTAGGAAQGLIGEVNYTSALPAITGGSETGATLTLDFASAPPWAVGQGVTLSGFTLSNAFAINNTWPVLSVTTNSITLNILGGSTATISTEGTATGALSFYDTAQTAGATAPTVATAGTISLETSSTVALEVMNSSAVAELSVDTIDGIVIIGSSNSANTTQTLLQLNSDNTFTEAATCSTSTDQGALYYNSASNNVRACINGSWQDLVSTASLSQLLFGVVPNSGPTQGDLIGDNGNAQSPCKVYWVSATTFGVAACQAYSGGREISYAGTASVTVTGMTTTNIYDNVCFNSSGALVLMGGATATDGTQTAANLTTGSSIGAPLLCLATLKGSATTANNLAAIYDIRTFTTTTKTYATISSATQILGGLVVASANGIVSAPTAAATANIEGVIVAGTNASSTSSPNILIAVAGPQEVKTTAVTFGQYAEDGATAGYVTGSGTVGTTFDDLGVSLVSAATSCTTNTTLAASDCQFSTLVNINIH